MRRTYAGFPILRQERLEIHDLLLEAVRRIAGERQLVPDHAGGGIERFHRQPRRVRVGEIGEHQHRRGMLEEAVGHFLQRQPHVLEADFLADHVERHVREAVVHRAHHAREHGAVADAGVEDAHCRRARMQMRKLLGDAVRHLPLFAAGVDEQQIFLPVVEEAEIALRVRLARTMRGRGGGRRHAERVNLRCGCSDYRSRMGSFNHDWTGPLWRMSSHESMDAIECVGGDAAAVAQPRGELAVIDGAPSERGLRESR